MTRVTDPVADSGPTTQFAYYDRSQLGSCPAESAGRTIETRPDQTLVSYCFDARLEVSEVVSTAEESPELEELAVAGYAQKHSVSPDTARAALRIQDRASGLPEEITAGSANAGYGGVWFDHAQRTVKVGLTPGTDATPVQQSFTARGLTGSSGVVQVASTQRQLEDARERLMSALSDLAQANLLSASFRSSQNDVLLETATAMTSAQRQRVTAAAAAETVKVTVVASDEPTFATLDLACDRRACDPPMRGGIALWRTSPIRSDCTSGFMARTRTTAESPRVVTAGHCVQAWLATGSSIIGLAQPGERPPPLNTLGAPVANPAPVVGNAGDFGLITVEPTSRFYNGGLLSPWVYVSRNDRQGDPEADSGRTTRNPKYRIRAHRDNQFTGSARNVEGATVCATGAVSGTHCGEITKRGLRRGGKDVRRAELEVFNCNYDAAKLNNSAEEFQPGDSGGPVFKRATAYGIISAVIDLGKDSNGNQKYNGCRMYFAGAKEAESALNVDILPKDP